MNMPRIGPKAALSQLVNVCTHKTGQSYKVRNLLYSLWNGHPTSLLEVVCLDSAIRENLLIVLESFGHPGFFYDEIKSEFVNRGLFDWFVAAHDEDKAT